MLRTPLFAHEIALGGLAVPFAPDASALFSNSSSLSWMEPASVSATWSSPTLGVVSTGAIAAALPLGRFAAIGLGVSTASSSEQAAYDERRQRVGSFTDSEIGVVLGGSLAIGPGSVGASIRMLRRSISGMEITNTGYAVDLGGTLSFADQLYFGAVLANIAGEMVAGESTLRERIPWEARLTSTYVHALEERSETVRLDPSGTAVALRLRPRAYMLGTAGLRFAQIDSLPTLNAAAEVVPTASVDLGFRAGVTTSGDISGGFLYRLPATIARDLRLDYTVRWSGETSDLTHHVSLSAGI
jgi:hypothetical protein